jgi:hypothetical protein
MAHPITITIAGAAWYLGGLGLVLLYSGVSDALHPYRYAVLCLGTLLFAVPVFWLRTEAGTVRGKRREDIVHRVSRGMLFVLGLAAIAAIGILGITRVFAATSLLILFFLGYFCLGTYALSAWLSLVRREFYLQRCPNCLYDLSAVESPTCPECGRIVTPFETDPS